MNRAGTRLAAMAGLAVLALVGLVITAANYVEGMKSARLLELEFVGAELSERPLPEAIARFRLRNHSSLPLTLADLTFTLYLNQEYVGSYSGAGVRRVVSPAGDSDLEYRITLQSLFLQRAREAQASKDSVWVVRGARKIILPYRERTLFVQLRQQWSPP